MCPFCLMAALTAAASLTTGSFTVFVARLRRRKPASILQAAPCKSEILS